MITKNDELHLILIEQDLDAVFQTLCRQQIIVSGDSIPEVLMKFHQLPLIIDNGF